MNLSEPNNTSAPSTKFSRIRAALKSHQAPRDALGPLPDSVGVPAHLVKQSSAAPLTGTEWHATANQAGIWFLSQDQGHGGTYSVARQMRLEGDLHQPALERAVTDLIARHSVLRSTLNLGDSELTQRISGNVTATRYMSVVDLADDLPAQASRDQRLAEAIKHSNPWSHQAFDLENGPLFRVLLCRMAEADHLLVINAHHAITDGWSQSLMLEELGHCYNARRLGKLPKFPNSAPQFAELADAADGGITAHEIAAALDEWQQRFDGIPDCVGLPLDKPRPARSSGAGGRCDFKLSNTDFAAVRTLASRQRSTPFSLFMSAFALVVFKLTGQQKLPVGVPLANREDQRLKGAVGYFANTLPMVTLVQEQMTAQELVAGVTSSLFDTLRLQHTPFGQLVQRLNPERDAAYHPLFQLAFSQQPDRGASTNFDGLSSAIIPRKSVASRFDLTLMLDLSSGAPSFFMDYSSDLFHAKTIERWAADIVRALKFIEHNPHRPVADFALTAYPQMSPQISPQPEETTRSVHASFAAIVNRYPHKCALAIAGAPERTLSYEGLASHAEAVTTALQQAGVKPGDCVALVLPRGFNAVIAMLGVLNAGAIYQPIDPAAPKKRRQSLLQSANAKLLITEKSNAEPTKTSNLPQIYLTQNQRVVVPGDVPQSGGAPPNNQIGRDSAACLLYTSGSTGTPKGVLLPHRAILRLVRDANYAQLDERLVMLHLAPLDFDASIFELWAPLLNGGTCVIYPDRLPDPIVLKNVIDDHQITTAWFTSSLFNAFIDEMPQALEGLKEIFTGGEALSVTHVAKAIRALPNSQISNGYGPTENGTFTSVYRIPASFSKNELQVPIGSPIAGTAVHVLDAKQNPVPANSEGELWVSGDGVALGYLNLPDDPAFQRLPTIASGLLYRTGDRVRQQPNGTLEFIGRTDNQVKINGFRIELGEIEHKLKGLADIQDAVVLINQTARGKEITAHAVPRSGVDDTAESRVRAELEASLPAHMLPQRFVWLPAIPLTPNGKVDRKHLLGEQKHAAADPAGTEINSGTSEQLLQIWREILERPALQPDDNFFEVGGHSILAVRLMARVETEFGKRLPLGSLFEAPSVSGQLALLTGVGEKSDAAPPQTQTAPAQSAPAQPTEETKAASTEWSALVPVKPGGSLSPLFMVHAIGGQVHGFSHFANAFPSDLPVIGIQCRGYEPNQTPYHDMTELAASYVAEIRAHQPRGPYYLGGLSFGGLVAFEIAAQLERLGERIAFLLIGDTVFARGPHIHPANRVLARFPLPPLKTLPAVWRSYRARKNKKPSEAEALLATPEFARKNRIVREAHSRAVTSYEPTRIVADITLITADTYPKSRAALMRLTGTARWGWDKLTRGSVATHSLPGTHHTIFYGPLANKFSKVVAQELAALPDVAVARSQTP